MGLSRSALCNQRLEQLPWLPTLRQPTLVLAGDDDPIVPLVNARILARRIPRARLQVVHGGGHLFILERPAGMAELVARFLHSGAPA
jgi:poly(3-hydroxyoctanoate) depolymerase